MPNHSGSLRRSDGASRIGCLLGLAIVLIAGYGAVVLAGSEIDYRQLQGEAQRQAALAAELDDEAIQEAIAAQAAELQLPAPAGRATIRRLPGDRIQISIQYQDTVEFFGRWERVRSRRILIDQEY